MAQRFKFTVAALEKLATPAAGAQPNIVYDLEVPKLGCRVQPISGTKTFFLLKRVAGRTERKTFGVFPEVKIEQARKWALQLLSQVAEWKQRGYEGVSPMAAPEQGKLTLAAAFTQYLAGAVEPNARENGKDPRKAVTRRKWFWRYLASIEKREPGSVTPEQVIALHTRITADHGPVAANRAIELLRAVYRFLMAKRLVKDNPASDVAENREHQRSRFLRPDELVRFYAALEAEPDTDIHDVIALLLATGARKSNVYGMKWADVSLALAMWTIPPFDSKNGEPLTVNLSPKALAILETRAKNAQPGAVYVFPEPERQTREQGNVHTGHIEDWDIRRPWYKLLKRAGFAPAARDLTLHDLRRTYASYQAIGGSTLQQVGASLGHKSLAATEIYSRLLQSSARQSILNGEAAQEKLMQAERAKLEQPVQLAKPTRKRLRA